jgi:hypothetical protein
MIQRGKKVEMEADNLAKADSGLPPTLASWRPERSRLIRQGGPEVILSQRAREEAVLPEMARPPGADVVVLSLSARERAATESPGSLRAAGGR